MKKNSLFFLKIFVFTFIFFTCNQSIFAFSARRSSFFDSSLTSASYDYLFFVQEEKVSLDLKDASLNAVTRMISEQTGVNFVSAIGQQDGRRREAIKITAYLRDVPLKEAMEILFKANNLTYDYHPEADTFVVKEKDSFLETKIYNLKYARVRGSRMQMEIESILGGEGQSGFGGEKLTLREAIETVLTDSGKIVENSQNNSLVVSDLSSRFAVIDKIVEVFDVPPLKIMIEVEILDVAKDVVDKIGFRHEGIVADGLSALLGPYHGSRYLSNMGSFMDGTIFETDYRITAEFFKQDQTAKLLARPRILTLNNEAAEINVISDEIVATEIEKEDDTTTITVQRVSDISDYKGAGVSLRVTPQVNPETNEITLVLHPSVVSTSDSTFRDEFGNVFKNVDDRSTRSVVRLNEGETLLLGGLIEKKDSQTFTKVPFLGDIPILGGLFRHKDTTGGGDRELMIFLTPRILDQESVFSQRKIKPSLQREQGNAARHRAIDSTLNQFQIR